MYFQKFMERGLLVKHVKLTNKCLAHFKINMHVNEVTLHAEYPIVQTTPFKTHTHTHTVTPIKTSMTLRESYAHIS